MINYCAINYINWDISDNIIGIIFLPTDKADEYMNAVKLLEENDSTFEYIDSESVFYNTNHFIVNELDKRQLSLVESITGNKIESGDIIGFIPDALHDVDFLDTLRENDFNDEDLTEDDFNDEY